MQCLLGQVKFARGAPSAWTAAYPLIASMPERCRDGSLEHLCGQFVVLRATTGFSAVTRHETARPPEALNAGLLPLRYLRPSIFQLSHDGTGAAARRSLMSDLEGKVAVVTGASKGIGAAIAKSLSASGAAVVVNYAFGKEGADRVVADIKARWQ